MFVFNIEKFLIIYMLSDDEVNYFKLQNIVIKNDDDDNVQCQRRVGIM